MERSNFSSLISQIISEASTEPFDEEAMKVPLSREDEARYFTRLKGCRFHAYKIAPFLGLILRKLTTVSTYDVPTMAVDDKGNIYVNPRFALTYLSVDECIGVLAHEASHHATLTFFRQKGRSPQLWNIATDYIMNRDLLRAGFALPAMGCLPRLENNGEAAYVDVKDKAGRVKKVIDVSSMSAEKLYKELIDASKGNGEGEEGDGGSGMPSPLDEVIESGDVSKIKPIEGSPSPSDKSEEEIRRDIETSAQTAKVEQDERDEEERKKSKGDGYGGLRKHILKHHTPKSNWREILKQIIAKTVTSYDMGRPAKRPLSAGVFLPKAVLSESLPLVCAVLDTSGSMGPREINAFLSELKNIYRYYPRAQVMVLLAHTSVYYQALVNKGNIDAQLSDIAAKCQAGGGIDIIPVNNYIVKSNLDKKIHALIYLTDGWYCDPQVPTVLPKMKTFALVNDPVGLDNMQKIVGVKCFFVDFK
jgi:predicted metal-dependent peptidase